jgi:hypothetical protein
MYSEVALSDSLSLAGLNNSRNCDPSAICRPSATASATGVKCFTSTDSTE